MWIKVSNSDILTIGDYKVTNDDRIKLLHSYVSDWSLSMQPVNEDDQGEYICQVNTEPQIVARIRLTVSFITHYSHNSVSFIFIKLQGSITPENHRRKIYNNA